MASNRTKEPETLLPSVQSYEDERIVLSSFMISPEEYRNVKNVLNEDCFFAIKFRAIYRAIVELIEEGKEVDYVSVYERARYLDNTIILEEFNREVVAAKTVYGDAFLSLCKRLDEMRRRRAASDLYIQGYQAIHEMGVDFDASVKKYTDGIRALKHDDRNSKVRNVEEILPALDRKVNEGQQQHERGSLTGFRFLDRLGGIYPTEVWVIAAETSMGKTSFALSMMNNIVSHCETVAYYSLEMQSERLAAKRYAMLADISEAKLSKGLLSEYEKNNYWQARAANEHLDKFCYFDDNSSAGYDAIVSSIYSLVRKKGLKGAFIDYVQLLSDVKDSKKNTAQIIAEIAQGFKNIAMELNIWIVLISQVNRPQGLVKGEDRLPNLDKMSDSSGIAKASDCAILIWRPEARNIDEYADNRLKQYTTIGTAYAEVAKNRSGETGGRYLLEFTGESTKFSDVDYKDMQKYDKGGAYENDVRAKRNNSAMTTDTDAAAIFANFKEVEQPNNSWTSVPFNYEPV